LTWFNASHLNSPKLARRMSCRKSINLPAPPGQFKPCRMMIFKQVIAPAMVLAEATDSTKAREANLTDL
jgi:hypothetical protein